MPAILGEAALRPSNFFWSLCLSCNISNIRGVIQKPGNGDIKPIACLAGKAKSLISHQTLRSTYTSIPPTVSLAGMSVSIRVATRRWPGQENREEEEAVQVV